MITGIGHDLCNIGRIGKLLDSRAGQRFEERILAPQERLLAAPLAGRRRAEFIAGRFAAKEAVAKALGCGIGASASFSDIAIVRAASGRPCCELSPRSLAALGYKSQPLLHVTITHDSGLASAFAVLEQR